MFFNIADLEDPRDKWHRTFRQVNAAQSHQIPIGALVEETSTGIRLFVAEHTRDCDKTPLYSLSAYQDSEEQAHYPMYYGYSDECLMIVGHCTHAD